MTIDEAIKCAEETAEYNQKVVDTHHISDDISLDELYADDTEIIEECLEGYKECADDYRQLAEWLKELKQLREQQPCTCEDAISRKAVFEIIDDCHRDGFMSVFCSYKDGERFKDYIKELPSVIPTLKWIPVIESLPELGHDVLGIDPYNNVLQACTYDDCGEIKLVSYRGSNTLIVAWMPLPEPYEAEQEDKDNDTHQ